MLVYMYIITISNIRQISILYFIYLQIYILVIYFYIKNNICIRHKLSIYK